MSRSKEIKAQMGLWARFAQIQVNPKLQSAAILQMKVVATSKSLLITVMLTLIISISLLKVHRTQKMRQYFLTLRHNKSDDIFNHFPPKYGS